MFKNPLKYASGGTMLPSEQQAENDFISVIAEGLGAQPEQVKARLEQIKSNPTESQQLQEALQLMQQDKNKGFQAVLSLFAGKPQSAKRGGKIQDFICKHSRGGAVAGCGCEKPVEKHQQENGKGRGIIDALSGLYNRFVGQRMPDVPGINNRRVRTWTDANGIQHIVEDANVNGNSTVTTIDINGADTLGTQKITTGDGRYRMVNLQPGTPQWRSVMSRNVPQQENGGKVEKAQNGTLLSLEDPIYSDPSKYTSRGPIWTLYKNGYGADTLFVDRKNYPEITSVLFTPNGVTHQTTIPRKFFGTKKVNKQIDVNETRNFVKSQLTSSSPAEFKPLSIQVTKKSK